MAYDPAQVTYTGGTVTLSATTVQSLLALLQAQVSPNVAPECFSFTISTDASGPVFIGPYNNTTGLLSNTNYARQIAASSSVTYVPGSFGQNNPLGNIYVYATGTFTLHVEIIP